MEKKLVLAFLISLLLMGSICVNVASTETDKEATTEDIKTKQELNLNGNPFNLKIKSRLFSVKYTITPTSSCDGHNVYTGKWTLIIGEDTVANKNIPLNCNPEHAFTGNSGALGFGIDTARAELKIYEGSSTTGSPIQSLVKTGSWFFGIFLLH
jgi:hypothetical protein